MEKQDLERLVNEYLKRFDIREESSALIGNVLQILKNIETKDKKNLEDYLVESKQSSAILTNNYQYGLKSQKAHINQKDSLSFDLIQLNSSITLKQYLYYSQSTEQRNNSSTQMKTQNSELAALDKHSLQLFQPFLLIIILVLLLCLYFL